MVKNDQVWAWLNKSQHVSCLGKPLPGKWTDMSRPEVDLTEMDPERDCPLEEDENENPAEEIVKRGKGALLSLAVDRRGAERKRAIAKRDGDDDSSSDLRKRARKRALSQLLTVKRAGQPFNEMKRKRAGQPFNEMRRKRSEEEQQLKKRTDDAGQEDAEEATEDRDNFDYPDLDEDKDIDYSQYWSEYDTFGIDKRGLGSMKKRALSGRAFKTRKTRRRVPVNQRLSTLRMKRDPEVVPEERRRKRVDEKPRNLAKKQYRRNYNLRKYLLNLDRFGNLKKRQFSNDKFL